MTELKSEDPFFQLSLQKDEAESENDREVCSFPFSCLNMK